MKKKGFWKNVWQFKALILMALPVSFGSSFFYIPVFVNVVAFKDFRLSPDGFLPVCNRARGSGLIISNFYLHQMMLG